mgnify:CR=1 FL=1
MMPLRSSLPCPRDITKSTSLKANKQSKRDSKRCAQIRNLAFWNAESYGYCVSSPWQPKSKDACGKLPCIRSLSAISFSSCFLIGTHLRVGHFSCNFSFLWKRNSKIFEILWKITLVYLQSGQISENKKKMSYYKELFYGYLLTLLNLIIYNWEGR